MAGQGYIALSLMLPMAAALLVESCVNQNKMCDIHGDNQIQFLPGITVMECNQLCIDTHSCHFYTYFGLESFPYQEMCMLFSSCDILDDCSDCFTANIEQDCTCGISFEGSINADNIIQFQDDVQTEEDCRLMCSSDDACSVYTYYTDDHVTNPTLCTLLKSLHAPVRSCEHCNTGSDKCPAVEECSLAGLYSDSKSDVEKILVSETSTIIYLSCQDGVKMINAIAVGSGARGGDCNAYGAGGGSGLITSAEIAVPRNTNILVEIDRSDGAVTSIKRGDTGDVLLSASNGTPDTDSDDKCFQNGTNGFSGGGGCSYPGDGGNGGSDGGNGTAGNSGIGGKGSGFNISCIPTNHFHLSAGHGGNFQGQYGGGGGGLLVDGMGPNNGFTAGKGQGYGGGGKGDPADVSGSLGCVLLEV